jgi:hypothetical protein
MKHKARGAMHKAKSSTCWSSLSIAYLSSSYGTYVNKSSPWVQTVSLSLPISHSSHEPALIQKLTKDKKITVAEAFNLTFRYIGDVLWITILNCENLISLLYLQRTWDIRNSRNSFPWLISSYLCHQWLTFD